MGDRALFCDLMRDLSELDESQSLDKQKYALRA
jgi:hypothetical protein